MTVYYCDPTRWEQLDERCRNPKCRVCEGTGRVVRLLWRGRYRTKLEIARWLLDQPEWAGARVGSLDGNVYIRKGEAYMRLEGFTPEALAQLRELER